MTEPLLDYNDKEIRVGARIELSPGCDLWMRGARFGAVMRIVSDPSGERVCVVRMDHPQVKKLQRVLPTNLQVRS